MRRPGRTPDFPSAAAWRCRASARAWGPLGAPRGLASFSRLCNGEMVDAARRAALLAATRCRRAGITVSVVYPDDRADVVFAHQLAAAGGGQARGLRPA